MNRINISMEFNSPKDAEKAFDVFIRDLTNNYTLNHEMKFRNRKDSNETTVTIDEDDVKVFASLTKEKE